MEVQMRLKEVQVRLIAIAIIAVFVLVMAIPAVYGVVSHQEPSCALSPDENQLKTVAVEIRECLGGASYSSYTVEIPKERILEIQDKLRDASDIQHKLELLHEYGLIHEDISWQHIQRQYDIYGQKQRLSSSFFNTLPAEGTDDMLVNLNCDMMCLSPLMIAFPWILPGLGFVLVSSAIPLPFSGLGGVFWLFIKLMLLATVGQLVPALAPFVGYTPVTVPFGLFWGPGIVDTNGTSGHWSAGGWLTGMVIGHFGIWVNAIFFTLFLGHASAMAVHIG